MLRFLQVAALAAVVMTLTPLSAQTSPAPPKVELFGGYSLAHQNPESTYNGWTASGTFSLNQWLGITADVSGHYRTQTYPTIDVHSKFYYLLFGPQFKYRKHRIEPFGHALFGVNRLLTDAGTLHLSNNGFAMALGGGVDIKANQRLAIRVGQLEYLLTHVPAGNQSGLRFSAGLVIRF